MEKNDFALLNKGSILLCNGLPKIGITTKNFGDFTRKNGNTNNQKNKMLVIAEIMKKKHLIRMVPKHDCTITAFFSESNIHEFHESDSVIYMSRNYSAFQSMIHCSWITLADRIVEKSIAIINYNGIPSNKLKAVIYGGICRNCYEVDENVRYKFNTSEYSEFFQNTKPGKYNLNLSGLIQNKLIKSGVSASQIRTINVCSQHNTYGDFQGNSGKENEFAFYSLRDRREMERNLIFTSLPGHDALIAGTTGNCPYVILY